MWENVRSNCNSYLGMSPLAWLVLLEYWIQLSYTDVESSPGASTWRTNTHHVIGSWWCVDNSFVNKCWRETPELTQQLTCFAALKMIFCSDGIPEALRVALAEEWKMKECFGLVTLFKNIPTDIWRLKKQFLFTPESWHVVQQELLTKYSYIHINVSDGSFTELGEVLLEKRQDQRHICKSSKFTSSTYIQEYQSKLC